MLKMYKMLLLLCFTSLLLANDYKIQEKDNEIIIFSIKQSAVNSNVLIPQNEADKTLINNTKSRDNAHNIVLIKNPKFIALIDTGFPNTREVLEQRLKSYDVNFSDITHIILTHAHIDHIGGLMEYNPFSKAQILIDKKEYDFWVNGDNDGVKTALKSLKNIAFFNNSENLINKDSNLKAIAAYGHTPGHNIIELTPNLLFVADIFHALDVQIKNPKIAVTYDVNKSQAIETREKFLRDYKGFLFVGTHTPFTKPEKLQ